MTIEDIIMLIINFEMTIEDCFYVREIGDKAGYDIAINKKREAQKELLEAIKQYKEQE